MICNGNDADQKTLVETIKDYNDILFVFASGNNSHLSILPNLYSYQEPNIYNQDLPNLVLVGSTDLKGKYANHSLSSNEHIHLGALGFSRTALQAGGKTQPNFGSSLAAPRVSQACGKIRYRFPKLTAPLTKQAILESSDHDPDLSPYFQQGRRLNIENALEMAAELHKNL